MSSSPQMLEPEESTRWRFSDVELGELDPEDMDVLGLTLGVRSHGRRRDGVLKLKLMLKISLGRRFLRAILTGLLASGFASFSMIGTGCFAAGIARGGMS
jgi:hypothetical protein